MSELRDRGLQELVGPTPDGGSSTPNERCQVAQRLAALSVLCARPYIVQDGAPSTAELSIDDLDDRAPLARTLLRRSRLFRSDDDRRLVIHPRSFADQLAARELQERLGSSCNAVDVYRELLADEQHVIHPRLIGVALRLANEHDGWRDVLVDRQPGLMVRIRVPPGVRAQLIDNLRERYAKQELPAFGDGAIRDFRNLAHDGLAQQLRGWLDDRGSELARTAIRIAVQCETAELVPDLIELARSDERAGVRTWAAFAAARLVTDKDARDLVKLASYDPERDPDEEIRGVVLSALWPDAFDHAERWHLISPAAQPAHAGAYRKFLLSIPKRIRPEHLEGALGWALQLNPLDSETRMPRAIVRAIVDKAIDHSDNPDVKSGLIELLEKRPSAGVYPSPDERERLIAANPALRAKVERWNYAGPAVWQPPPPQPPRSLSERLAELQELSAVRLWADVLHHVQPEFLPPLNLADRPEWDSLSTDERQVLLDAAASYLADATLEPDPVNTDWLLHGERGPGLAAVRGVAALTLLRRCQRQRFDALPPDILRRYADACACLLPWQREERVVLLDLLRVLVADGAAEKRIARVLVTRLDAHTGSTPPPCFWWLSPHPLPPEPPEGATIDRGPPGVWTSGIERALFDWLVSNGADSSHGGEVLVLLLAHSVGKPRAQKLETVAQDWLTGAHGPEAALRAAQAVTRARGADGLAASWEALTDEQQVETLTYLADDEGLMAQLRAELTGRRIADIYSLLYDRLGPAQPGFVPDNELRFWRDGLVDELRRRGTPESVEALARLCGRYPDDLSRRWVLQEARAKLRATGRAWPTPREVRQLLEGDRLHRAATPVDLLTSVVTALRAVEKDLTASTEVWNYSPTRPSRYWPRTEPDVSDSIQRRLAGLLRRSLATPTREVELRPGRRADFVVRLPREHGPDWTVVVEAKGCWHSEVERAFESQLVDYIEHPEFGYGVYLVLWFDRTRWDRSSDRRRPKFQSYEEAQEHVQSEATRLQRLGWEVRGVVMRFKGPGQPAKAPPDAQ